MKLDLNLTYLKFFHDAALSGSVSESAKRNFVTQSAISQAISKLEKNLKISLCHHKKQKFKLTEEGMLVFEQAREIFSSVRNLHDSLDRLKQCPKMPLNFVTTHSVGLSLLPSLWASFEEKYGQISLHFQLGGLSQIRGWLKQGIAEFGLVLEGMEFAEYDNQGIYSGSFSLFKNKKEQRKVHETGIYVEHRDGYLVGEFLKKYSARHGTSLKIKAEVNSWEFAARCLQKEGYALLPDLILHNGRYPEIVKSRDVKLSLPYQVNAVSLKGEALSYTAQTFLDFLKTSVKD